PAAGACPEWPLPAGRPRPTAPSPPALQPTRLHAPPPPRRPRGFPVRKPRPASFHGVTALHCPPLLGAVRRRRAGAHCGGRRLPQANPAPAALAPGVVA